MPFRVLKHELKNDQKFQSPKGTRSAVIFATMYLYTPATEATELYFLIPPKQRVKSRYLNIDTHIRWGQKILAYFKKGDFSQISTELIWDKKTLKEVPKSLSEGALSALSSLPERTYSDLTIFSQKIRSCIGAALFAKEGDLICLAASVGRRIFIDKLGWIIDYQPELEEYSQMINLVHLVQKQVKRQGLNKN